MGDLAVVRFVIATVVLVVGVLVLINYRQAVDRAVAVVSTRTYGVQVGKPVAMIFRGVGAVWIGVAAGAILGLWS